ncbi:MAG: hypothetical protein DMF42_04910 [Verrucomicrobia bacterium]|nr:MAG: hypothetical protein DME87_13685 [Verrucomicrobiota bacterium]PYJ63472.1 MAG: hypothetical protein DME74_03165 [Verrucomicrobiota bacterium]PYL43129.1 MAG: hypothetical protein DMF42_04910 [Verrucomicrobiota bacterium]
MRSGRIVRKIDRFLFASACFRERMFQAIATIFRSVREMGFDHLVRVSSLANPAISPIPLPSLRFLNV